MSEERGLEPSMEEKGGNNVATFGGKKSKKDKHQKIDLWSDEQAYNADAFQGETDIVEYHPAAGGVIKAEIRLNALSPQNLEDYDEEIRLSTFFSNRVNALFTQLAKMEDIGDYDEILAGDDSPDLDFGSDEAGEIWARIRELKPKTSSMKISIESIILPTVVKWNYRRENVIVPISVEAIKEKMVIGDVTGLAQAITKRLTSGKKQGKK